MLAVATLALWALILLFAAWWLAWEPDPVPAPSAPRDPVVELVDKWAHDWERGRA